MRSIESRLAKLEEHVKSAIRNLPAPDEPCSCETKGISLYPFVYDSDAEGVRRFLTPMELHGMLPKTFPETAPPDWDNLHCQSCGGLLLQIPVYAPILREDPVGGCENA